MRDGGPGRAAELSSPTYGTAVLVSFRRRIRVRRVELFADIFTGRAMDLTCLNGFD